MAERNDELGEGGAPGLAQVTYGLKTNRGLGAGECIDHDLGRFSTYQGRSRREKENQGEEQGALHGGYASVESG
ncbi:MAG: hypothetical protein ACYTGH_02310 [Planctomycetota bacterium]